MNLLIDARGHCQPAPDVDLSCAIWREGFVHIREGKTEIVISLSPSLVKGPALAAAVYAIADINPKYISLILEKSDCIAVMFHADWKTACRRICELVAASRRTEQVQIDIFDRGDELAAEPEVLDDPEQIIGTTLKRHVQGDPETLTRRILEELWEAGYDVRPHHC